MRLSSQEAQLLELSRRNYGGFHLATQWYLRDWNPLGYQYVWHHVPVGNTTAVAGIASGKTSMVSASYTIDCMTYPGFRALNASVTAKQAELALCDGGRAGGMATRALISSSRTFHCARIRSSLSTMARCSNSALPARAPSSFEVLNMTGSTMTNLSSIPPTRPFELCADVLRGRRPDGSVRMARLDCTGTPSYAVWLRERFYKGLRGIDYATPETLKYFWSLRIETYDNKRLTAEQIKLMEADYPPELIDVELRGLFPDYGLSMFPISHITACTDASLNDEMDVATAPREWSPCSWIRLYRMAESRGDQDGVSDRPARRIYRRR